jgi:hypothetical protein
MVPEAPPVPSWGKCSSSTARPSALSESGASEEALKSAPTTPAAATTVARATSHSPIEASRWSKLQPPSRASGPGGDPVVCAPGRGSAPWGRGPLPGASLLACGGPGSLR